MPPKRPNERITLGATNSAILRGDDDLTAWDDEELMRGQRRNKNGRWTGRPPKVVPKAVHDELVKRKMSQAFELLRDNIVGATSVLIELATDPTVDPGVRLKAAGMILDRTLGKAPERIDIRADLNERADPWRDAIVAAVVPSAELGGVLDVGEVDDLDDDDGDDD